MLIYHLFDGAPRRRLFPRRNIVAMQTDPVCGMQVDEQRSPAKSEYQGTDYYFCSMDCKRKFDQQPEQYTGQAQRGGQSQSSGQAQRGGSTR